MLLYSSFIVFVVGLGTGQTTLAIIIKLLTKPVLVPSPELFLIFQEKERSPQREFIWGFHVAPGWPGIPYVAEDDLRFLIPLPLFPKHWDCKPVPPCRTPLIFYHYVYVDTLVLRMAHGCQTITL